LQHFPHKIEIWIVARPFGEKQFTVEDTIRDNVQSREEAPPCAPAICAMPDGDAGEPIRGQVESTESAEWQDTLDPFYAVGVSLLTSSMDTYLDAQKKLLNLVTPTLRGQLFHCRLYTSMPKLHFCREQYEDARRLYRTQVEQWEKVAKGPDNIGLGEMLIQLALAEVRTGHLEEAISAYEEAAAKFESEWCEGHPRAIAARKAKAALESGAAPIQLSS
jgi:hypothetical protein